MAAINHRIVDAQVQQLRQTPQQSEGHYERPGGIEMLLAAVQAEPTQGADAAQRSQAGCNVETDVFKLWLAKLHAHVSCCDGGCRCALSEMAGERLRKVTGLQLALQPAQARAAQQRCAQAAMRLLGKHRQQQLLQICHVRQLQRQRMRERLPVRHLLPTAVLTIS